MAAETQKCGVIELFFYAELVPPDHTHLLSGCGLL